ncbi:substrate-binding domain-containing protein [Pseudomonas aeruginosa]|nr:substrate-binding domain-containing protein [Pseudomonas aeruginosa]
MKAGDEVGIIEGVSTTTNAQQRTAGFKDAMDAAGMKIVSLQSATGKSRRATRWLRRCSTSIRTSRRCSPATTAWPLGAVSAVRAAGRAGQVKVVGYDNIQAIKPMLQDGRVLATADQFAREAGGVRYPDRAQAACWASPGT